MEGGDVACREDAYRDAAGTFIQACDGSPDLCDHHSSVELMDCVSGDEEWMWLLEAVNGVDVGSGLRFSKLRQQKR